MSTVRIRVENVTDAKHRAILNDLLAGEFSYTPDGKQIDAKTFEFEWGVGEYAVVSDELLDKSQNEMVTEGPSNYRTIYNAFPRTVTVEKGDEFTVSL